MRAAVSRAPGRGFEIEDVELAEPRGREVLIDVRASGLCHSDFHIASDGFDYAFPSVLGHEVAGVVVGLGPEVADFRLGDHVAASLIQYCGHCEPCLDGRLFQCWNPSETQRGEGEEPRLTMGGEPLFQYSAISGFAEQVLVHENQLARIPDEIPFSQASLLGCGVITGAGAMINSAQVRPGDTVVVVGCGGVGLNAVQGARLAGAETIIAVDMVPRKLELAKKFGSTHIVNSADQDPLEAIRAVAPRGVDHAFEMIGLPVTCRLAIDAARVGGSIYIIGLQKPGASIPIYPWDDMIGGQKRIIGVTMGSTNPRKDIPMYARMYLDGRLNLDDLVSREIALDEINDAYAALERGEVARNVITSF